MTSQEEMLDRRVDMLFLDRLGVRPKDRIQEIAFKFKTTPEAIQRDWGRRKQWMRQILKVEDADRSIDVHDFKLKIANDFYFPLMLYLIVQL